MKRIIIHTGYHKSASTFIQKIFENSRLNYLYLSRTLLDEVEGLTFDADNFKKNIVSSVRRYEDCDTLLLTNEELSGHPHGYDNIDPFRTADNLHKTFPDANILTIIRNQVDYLLSLYAFRVAVKGAEFRSIKRFLQEDGARGLFDKLEYDRLIRHYIDLFGQDRVKVLPMEMLRKDAHQFYGTIEYMLGETGIRIDGSRQKELNTSTKIHSLISIYRSLNFIFHYCWAPFQKVLPQDREMRYRYRFYRARQSCTRALTPYCEKGSRISIPREIIEECRTRYPASNARLSKLIGIDLQEYGYL